MKFAKILHAESVPEWRKKYIDYKTLKALLRKIEKTNLREAEIQSQVESMQSKTSRTFSLLSDNIPGMKPLVQKMSAKFMNLSKRGSYNTPVHYRDYLHRSVTPETFLDHLNDDERTFFLKLDDELSDISKFYEGKEKEAVENLRSLKLQYKEMRELKKNKSDQKQDPASSLDEYAYKPTKEIDYKHARKNIKKAIFEFYRGIELLKNYRVLNKLGFIKILKKFDKTAGWNGSYIYMQKVDASNFVTSKVLDQVIKETENFYVDKFEGGMRRQAMMKLRLPNRERQTYYFTIWRVGMYLGISSCLCAYAVPTFFDQDNVSRALLTLFGGLLLPILFALLLGLNMYAWTKSRINYKFIFEFDSRENLDYRQFFELPSIALLILSCAVYFATLNPAFRTWYPVIFGIIFLSIFLCPFPVFYYDARRWTIMSMFRVVGAYWFRVEFRDFFIADVMNSMAYSFVILGVFGCSYIRYWPDDEACYSSTRWWVPILASIPPFWRILQCLRRYKATRQAYPHLVNTGKYVSTIIATVFLFEYRQRKGKGDLSDGMFVTWIVVQTINTIYTSMWDLVMDWSLLQSDSENLFLRDDLGYKHKGVYYFAMISNVILRFSWVSLAALRHVDSNHQNSSHWLNLVSFAIAFLEMLRRLQWALFRVENEHINNCGQFRAVKEFHLPFPKGELNNVVVGRDSSSTENTSDPKNTLKKRPTATRQGSSRGMNFVRSVLPKRRPSSLTSKDFEPRLDQSAAGMADYSDGEHDEDDDELSAEEASNTSFDDDLISAERKNMEREASLKTLENQSIQNIRNSMFSNSTSLPSSSSDDKNSLYNSRKLSLPLLPRSNSSSLPGPNDPDGSAIRRRILGERTEEEMVNTQSNDIVSAGEPQQEDNLEQDVRSRISE